MATTFTPRVFIMPVYCKASMIAALSNTVPSLDTLSAMMCAWKSTPITPRPLLPEAAMVPLTCVP